MIRKSVWIVLVAGCLAAASQAGAAPVYRHHRRAIRPRARQARLDDAGPVTRPPIRRLPWIRLLVGLILVVAVMAARAALKDPAEPFWRLRGGGPRTP